MAVYLDERRGSRDFDQGTGGNTGKLLFFVTGAADENEALAAVLADSRVAPVINGYLLEKWAVTEQGADLYYVDLDYKRGIPSQASDPSAGQTPSNARPSNGEPNNTALSRDMSFSTGGGTRKCFISKETRHKLSKNNGAAPDFGGLIGVDLKTGEVHGCDVLAASADFTITKRFPVLTVGWFRFMLDCVACQNVSTFLNLDEGEVLFKGSDGQYKDGDPVPWTVTGRFGYSRNLLLETDPDDCTFGEVTVPDIQGWNYVWTVPKVKTETVTVNGLQKELKLSYPEFVYVERVYKEAELNNLGFN